MADVKLEYTVKSEAFLDELGERHLLDLYYAIREGHVSEDEAPPGFLAAISKLYDDASESLILHTLMGEIVAGIFIEELPRFFPSIRYGFHFKPLKVAYQELPATLDPPVDAEPLIVVPASKAVH